MWPHSLLFSSDEEASRALSGAFRDLEFEVETCPEIFGAVERITGLSFDVVVSDWNEGLEAVFLLKTVRELKSNHSAFTIAIAGPEAATAAREAGADLVLSRPLVPEQVKYDLLTCDAFLSQMQSWLARQGQTSKAKTNPEAAIRNKPLATNLAQSNAENPLPRLQAWPSPPPPQRTQGPAPVVAAESIFDQDLPYQFRVQAVPRVPEPSFSSSATLAKKPRNRVLPGLAIAVAFLSVGYVFSEPLRGEGTAKSVATIYGRMLERTQAWLHRPDEARAQGAAVLAENPGIRFARASRRDVQQLPVIPVPAPNPAEAAASAANPQQTVSAEAGLPAQRPVTPATTANIPDSLKIPSVQTASMRSMAVRVAPSLLAAMEPVSLSEDLSRRLLRQKVLPSYPDRAIKAGLQGPVVLQAWIGRDGTIQDLKLVRGSLLLGQAAYRAVKQWRYQPYVLNGRAVEAETFVTVDFRLP